MSTYERPLVGTFPGYSGYAASVSYKVIATDFTTVLLGPVTGTMVESADVPGTYLGKDLTFDYAWRGYIVYSITSLPGVAVVVPFLPGGVDLTQPLGTPPNNAHLVAGDAGIVLADAMWAAFVQAFGIWSENIALKQLHLSTATGTPVRDFTLDSGFTPTQRS